MHSRDMLVLALLSFAAVGCLCYAPASISFRHNLSPLEFNRRSIRTVNDLRLFCASASGSESGGFDSFSPGQFDEQRKNLEDAWRIFEQMKVDEENECDISGIEDLSQALGCSEHRCHVCSGEGRTPCRFCKGSTLLTMGDYVDVDRKCMVCKGGREECFRCKGAGWVAAWRNTESGRHMML